MISIKASTRSRRKNDESFARFSEDDWCYMCAACVCRHICRCSMVIPSLVILSIVLLVWLIIATRPMQTDAELQIRLNQQRYLNGKWNGHRKDRLTLMFQGRLGNLMFQYAAVFCEARKQNMLPVVPEEMEMWKTFSLSAIPEKFKKIYSKPWRRTVETIASGYDPAIENLPTGIDVQLYGYFQSWKYCIGYENELRQELHIADYLLKKALAFLTEMLRVRHVTTKSSKLAYLSHYLSDPRDSKNPYLIPDSSDRVTLVGMHIRRGDTVHSQEMTSFGYITANVSYYDSATKYFRDKYKNVLFVVCTDEPSWVKETLRYPDMVLSVGNSKEVDFAILSLCEHTIVSIGSFGWWAAWLANGETTYYGGWPKKDSKLDATVNKTEYFPNHWIPMV